MEVPKLGDLIYRLDILSAQQSPHQTRKRVGKPTVRYTLKTQLPDSVPDHRCTLSGYDHCPGDMLSCPDVIQGKGFLRCGCL